MRHLLTALGLVFVLALFGLLVAVSVGFMVLSP